MSENSFSELFKGFTGTGDIDSKYWIIGIEPGGELETASAFFDEYYKHHTALTQENDYFNEQIEGRFLRNLETLLYCFNDINKTIVENGKFYFTGNNVFRTNLFLLKFCNIKEGAKFKLDVKKYKEYFNDLYKLDIKSRKDIYTDKLILCRAKNLKPEREKKKIILCFTLSYFEETKLFLENIFNVTIKDKDYKRTLLNIENKNDYRYVYKYNTDKENISIYFFPQDRWYNEVKMKNLLRELG